MKILSIALLVTVVGITLLGCTERQIPTNQQYSGSCVMHDSTYTVRGSSMSGVVEQGAQVHVLEGYERCNNLSRGDIVLYDYSGDPIPLIKMVKGIPGDTWRLDGCNIVVNGKNLTNSQGIPYCIADTRRLQLYVSDYPTIPEDTYLLMGNAPGGSTDSSVFGLVDKSDMLGKVRTDD